MRKAIFVFALIVPIVTFPFSAQAGIFSFMAGPTKTVDASTGSDTNSQTLSVLEATPSSNPKASLDVPVMIAGSSIVANIGPLGTESDVANLPATDQISIHVVRDGDTIASIAKLYDVSVGTILVANNLSRGDKLTKGQVLTILPFSGIEYTVKKGDTLAKIAKKYGAPADDIVRYNDITVNTDLVVGTTLLIPDAEGFVLDQNTSSSTSGTSSSSSSSSSSTQSTGMHGKSRNTTSYPNFYIWPIAGHAGRITQGAHGSRMNGIDIGAPKGSTIVASAAGTVLIAATFGYNSGFGEYVVIEHPENGTKTLYAHMSKVLVTPGQTVAQGDAIGEVGSTGHSTGPHVHYEVRLNDVINPGINNTWKN